MTATPIKASTTTTAVATTVSNNVTGVSSDVTTNSDHTDGSVGHTERETSGVHEPCTILCPNAAGQVPQLQCVKCLCLYHHECVGLNPNNSEYRIAGDMATGRDYVCETCLSKSMESNNSVTPKSHTVGSTSKSTTHTAKASPSARSRNINSTPKSSVSRSPNTNKTSAGTSLPQSIAVVKGKKYVVVGKSISLSATSE